jgi:hypothetical protein
MVGFSMKPSFHWVVMKAQKLLAKACPAIPAVLTAIREKAPVERVVTRLPRRIASTATCKASGAFSASPETQRHTSAE